MPDCLNKCVSYLINLIFKIWFFSYILILIEFVYSRQSCRQLSSGKAWKYSESNTSPKPGIVSKALNILFHSAWWWLKEADFPSWCFLQPMWRHEPSALPETQDRVRDKRIKAKGAWGLPWWGRSWRPLRGRVQPAGAMAYSGIQISPGIKPVSPVSPALLVILYPLNHWGSKVCTWINLGKLCLIFFWLFDIHCPLALGNFLQISFSIERQYVSWYHGNHFPCR